MQYQTYIINFVSEMQQNNRVLNHDEIMFIFASMCS